ncbi:MAG: hypothetical protein ACXVC0_18865, partial [Bdellovibrionota bacterium]
ADYLRLVSDLRELAKRESDDSLLAKAAALYGAYYSNPAIFTHTTFLESPLPAAMAGEGEAPVHEGVNQISAELKAAVAGFSAVLTNGSYLWPRALPELGAAITALDGYVTFLTDQTQAMPISGLMKAAAQMQIQSQYAKLRPTLQKLVQGLEGARSTSQTVLALKHGVTALGLSLKAADAARLNQVEGLGKQLDSMQDAQGALGVLVTLWQITPAGGRGAFQKASPELYDFLNGKSDDDLDCLAHPACPNPVLGISKLVIFHKLEAYGLEKIHAQVDREVKDSLVSSARAEILSTLPKIPLMIRDQVTKQTAAYFATLEKVRADVPGFIRARVSTWAGANFKESLRGLETDQLVVSINGSPAVRPAAPVSAVVSTGSDTIGASLAVAQEFLPLDDATALRPALTEPILKVLALGGFRQDNGKPFPGFLLPLTGSPARVFVLEDLMKDSTSYAVPDSFRANAQFQMDRLHAARKVSAGAQAQMLLGLSRQIAFYRDWEQNTFDVSLGKILVNDLVPELPQGVVKSSFLPKDMLFALSVMNAGAVLRAISADTVQKAAPADLARTVLALDAFLQATDGAENSRSAPLLGGLMEGRKSVESLEAALAGRLGAGGSLAEQALTIRALLVAAERLGQPLLRETALKVFAGMSLNGEPSLPSVMSALLAGEELAGFMSADTRTQWDLAAKPWLKALRNL